MSSSLQSTIRDLQLKRGRERRGLTLAEGVRLVEEALAAAVPVRGAAIAPALEGTARGKALKAALAARGTRLEEVGDGELDQLADTEHPQGIVAIIEPKRWGLHHIDLHRGGAVLVLDGVQDPGNVGTMLRTAHALGAAGVVALKGTAELTNPKVVRGSMGALFKTAVDIQRRGGLPRMGPCEPAGNLGRGRRWHSHYGTRPSRPSRPSRPPSRPRRRQRRCRRRARALGRRRPPGRHPARSRGRVAQRRRRGGDPPARGPA